MAPEESQRALQYAMRLLGYRQRSMRELSGRLQRKGFSPGAVRHALERLAELGYLDDTALARALRARAEEVKLLGAAGAMQYLRLMGVEAEDARGALAGYDEYEVAKRLLGKRLGALGGQPPQTARRRLAGYLRRRGFSSSTLRKILANYMREA